jgi:hypothetical protein
MLSLRRAKERRQTDDLMQGHAEYNEAQADLLDNELAKRLDDVRLDVLAEVLLGSPDLVVVENQVV